MELKKNIYHTYLLALFIELSCTDNPFWTDPPTTVMKLTGIVNTENNITGAPAYVWLEGMDIDTVTNDNNEFIIELNSTQTPNGNINGPLKTYFYLHNYRIDHATIYFTDGHFSDTQTDFSTNGELLEPVLLEKLVSAEISIPPIFNTSFEETLKVKLYLDVHNSTTWLIGYKRVLSQNMYLPSGVIFRSKLDPQVIHIDRLYHDSIVPLEYGPGSAITWTYEIDSDSLQTLSGEYAVFPFFIVSQDHVPDDLLYSLGINDIFTINSEYLQLPMDMTPGTLIVQ